MEKIPAITGSRQSLIESSQKSGERKDHATRCAKILLGCYRTGDANDPEIYVTSVVAILAMYPVEIMERVVNPLEGLPAKLKWLPALAEVREACEEAQAPAKRLEEMDRRARDWEEQVRQQLADREEFDRAQKKNPTYEELRAKYDGPNGEPWGISAGKYSRVSSREQAGAALISKIGQQAFDAIPDNPAADYRSPK